MNIVKIIALIILLALPSASSAQSIVPDWMSKATIPEVESPLPSNSPLDDFVKNMNDTVDVLKAKIAEADEAIKRAHNSADKADSAAQKAWAAMEQANVAAKELASSQKVGDWQDSGRISLLEDAVKELQSRKVWTEDEIRVLAKEEAEKVMKATVKTSDGKTREVGASSLQVTVNGYAGTFKLNPGETIVAVDGQPIRGTSQFRSNGVVTDLSVTESVQLQTVPENRGVVRFWSLPNTTRGTCRTVRNPVTGRLERVCN